MQITIDAAYAIGGLLTMFAGFVIFIATTSSKTTDRYNKLQENDSALAKRVADVESELKNEDARRQRTDERMDERFSVIDRRVQGVETKVSGVEVKVDVGIGAIKESLTDLKKLVSDLVSSKS